MNSDQYVSESALEGSTSSEAVDISTSESIEGGIRDYDLIFSRTSGYSVMNRYVRLSDLQPSGGSIQDALDVLEANLSVMS